MISMSDEPLSFEAALARLEAIAEQIERGQIGLEESITRYEEGMTLVRQCRELLARAEHRIQQINRRADGSVEAVDFVAAAPTQPAKGSDSGKA
jgi:exodeoxyribonuclease VII small subunit